MLNAVPEKDHDGNCDNDGNDGTDEKITRVALVFHISQNDQTRAALARTRQQMAFMSFQDPGQTADRIAWNALMNFFAR